MISIHAPARGATCDAGRLYQGGGISIHAPARGATATSRAQVEATIFQSTHPRGVRRSVRVCAGVWVDFNPRTREGCDYVTHSEFRWYFNSIHAPARGATIQRQLMMSSRQYFNPRTREGCDSCAAFACARSAISIHAPARGATYGEFYDMVVHDLFQSTHPRGVRLDWRNYDFCWWRFQSTHPRGVRQRQETSQTQGQISIHAPARGATHTVSLFT